MGGKGHMQFSELPIGEWFDFAHRHEFSGVSGPYKKNGPRTYLYHSRGWYEAKTTSSLPVIKAEKPEYRPDELVDICVDWNGELNGYVCTALTRKCREDDGGYPQDIHTSMADGRTRNKAKAEALRESKEYALSLIDAEPGRGIAAEMAIVYLEGDEYLVVSVRDKVRLGVCHHRWKDKV